MTEIDDQQHRLALIAEIFGDRHRGLRREAPHHRAFVAGRNDGDRQLAVVAERVVEKLAHLAAALADQRDDHGVEIRRAREHGEQRRFADARAGENADALAGAERREEIDDAHAALDRLAHARRAVIAGGGSASIGIERGPSSKGPRPSIGAAERVDHAAFPERCGLQAHRPRAEGEIADAGVDARVEGFDRDARRVDPHHLAGLGAARRRRC